jgi:hypothetical protein
MKTIKVKKLSLSKSTITQLDNFAKNQVKGGRAPETRYSACAIDPCETGYVCKI